MERTTTSIRRLVVVCLVAGVAVSGALGVVAGATLLPAEGGSAAADAATQTDATLNLTTASAPAGETVTVELRTTASDVAGYQANVTFDPAVLQVASVTGADMDDPIVNANNESGWLFITQSAARGSDATVLAEITFVVAEDATGGSDLGLVEGDSLVNDGDGEHVAVDLGSGRVDVGQDGPAALGGGGLLSGRSLLLVVGGVGGGTALAVGLLAGSKLG